jgi:hypothetical protein
MESTTEHGLLRERPASLTGSCSVNSCMHISWRVLIWDALCVFVSLSICPHEKHYAALKQIALYLRGTKEWGIIYWRAKPANLFDSVERRHPIVSAVRSVDIDWLCGCIGSPSPVLFLCLLGEL